MSRLWPASSRPAAARLALAVAGAGVLLLSANGAQGQRPAPLLLFKTPVPADAERIRALVARRFGALARDPSASVARKAPRVALERLRPLRRIEALLASAREQAAALAEDQALGTLAEAARIGEQLGDVPGAAAWNAEIELGIGLTAAQVGLTQLAERAFRMAATLDPARRLLEAEAAPAVLQLYERVQREVAVAPLGELDVRVAAAQARVFLDDVALGPSPARFHASVGRHVLRVETPGHRVYGALIDVLEGVRPPLLVQPSPEPELDQARELTDAAQRGDYPAAVRALRALQRAGVPLGPVLVLESSPTGHKALLVLCQPTGCEAALRMSGTELPAIAPGTTLDPERLAEARQWLAQPSSAAPRLRAVGPAWWQHWYLWGGIAAAALAGTLLALSLNRQPAERLRVVIQPADIGQ
jgi:hypothetical protein